MASFAHEGEGACRGSSRPRYIGDILRYDYRPTFITCDVGIVICQKTVGNALRHSVALAFRAVGVRVFVRDGIKYHGHHALSWSTFLASYFVGKSRLRAASDIAVGVTLNLRAISATGTPENHISRNAGASYSGRRGRDIRRRPSFCGFQARQSWRQPLPEMIARLRAIRPDTSRRDQRAGYSFADGPGKTG